MNFSNYYRGSEERYLEEKITIAYDLLRIIFIDKYEDYVNMKRRVSPTLYFSMSK